MPDLCYTREILFTNMTSHMGKDCSGNKFLPTNSETYYFVPHFIFDAETMFPGFPDTTVKCPHIGNIGRYIRKTENSIVFTKKL
jgi:hypothetical protein